MDKNIITTFRNHFREHNTNYVLIGGVACSILMDEAGLDFRSTKDFDVVLLIEHIDESFFHTFWNFIKQGNYKGIEQGEKFQNFYRFINPQTEGFPKMIELFSKSPLDELDVSTATITPIPIEEEVSSLSAIILDEDYYNLLFEGRIEEQEISILNPSHLIVFKAKAWLDLKARKEKDKKAVDSKAIDKHRKDILVLHELLEDETQVSINQNIKKDMDEFLTQLLEEGKDISHFKSGMSLQEVVDDLRSLFQVY